MVKRYSLILISLALIPATFAAKAQSPSAVQQTERRSLRLLVEGDPTVVPRAIEVLQRKGIERGCEITYASGNNDSYDARVVFAGDTGSEWCSGPATSPSVSFAYGSVVVFMRDGRLLFTASRSASTPAAVMNLLTKEVIEDFQVYYPTLKHGWPGQDPAMPKPEAGGNQLRTGDEALAGLPAEVGVYYKALDGWVRLSEAPSVGTRFGGTGKSLLTWGLASVHTAQIFRGRQAPLQISEGTPTFYIRLMSILPRNPLIVRVQKKGDTRELRVSSMSTLGSNVGYGKDEMSEVLVTRVTEGVVTIAPRSALRPGEYVLRLAANELDESGYDFGIAHVKKK